MAETSNPAIRPDDRIVHARWAQMEVVRYDRAGKWYLEPVGAVSPRQQVTLKQAAEYAVWARNEREGHLYLDMPGGSRFDLLVDRMLNGI